MPPLDSASLLYVDGNVAGATGGQRAYLPAAGHDWFLPLYDPFVKLFGGDRVRRALVDQAAIRPGQRILDVGCGTGTLLLLLKRLHPTAEVVGLDPDPKALARARRKAEREGVSVQLDRGFSNELPYGAASFDLVFSSMMFHHLPAEEKGPTLAEIRRVLKPAGTLHLVDFAPGGSGPHPICGLMRDAGLADPQKTGERSMLFMRLGYYRASVA